MSLDVYLEETSPHEVYSANITHNLSDMARAAGIYQAVWHPEEAGITCAAGLVLPLREGIAKMEADPEKYRAFNPKNGWGSYEGFLQWLKEYLTACEQHPDAEIRASR